MRRAQVNDNSQPHRNLATNPSMVTANAGYVTLRQNLITNPGLEYSTGTTVVRTNLCTDPRGVQGTFAAYGSGQTITGNVAITGHPEGLTTATRVNYSSASNPGIMIYTDTVAGQTYSMSAWVYHETVAATPGSQGFAQAGITSSAGPAIVAGVWQRITWTHAPGGTNPYGFRVSGQTGAGSYLITGILFENNKEVASYFDGVTPPALRTNLATNPAPATSTGWSIGISAGGAQTSTLETTGSPVGANFRRMSITTAPATWARHHIATPISVSPGTTYAASAYLRINKSTTTGWIGIIWYGAGNAYISENSTNFSVTANAWTNGGITATAPANAVTMQVFIGNSAGNAAGDVIDAAGLLVEAASSNLPYFDGGTAATGSVVYGWRGAANASAAFSRDTDLTPNWAGSADASTPRLLGTSMEGWSLTTNSGFYRTANEKRSGTYSGACYVKGFSGDGATFTQINVTAGTAYTFSAYIKHSALPRLDGVLRWTDSNGTIISDTTAEVSASLVAGQWTRVSITGTAPANTVKCQPMWRVYVMHTPQTFYVDDALLEASPVLGTHFDGTTANAGDFLYGWNGTAHRSVSEQRAWSVVGQISTKSAGGTAIDSKFYSYQTTLEDGSKGMRFFSPAGTPNSSWRVAGIATGGWDWTQIKAGSKYTLWFRWRASGWSAYGSSIPVQISTGGSQNHVIGASTPTNIQSINAVGWQEYRRTFTALRDADAAQWVYISLPVTPSPSTDSIFDIRDFGLYEGEYTGDYIDGSKPFSKWDGTANQSTSVGYPPQLLDIAGKPLGDYTAAGDYTYANEFDPTTGVTLYTVFQTLAVIPANVATIAIYGENALSDVIPNSMMTLRQNATNTPSNRNDVVNRRTGGGGALSPTGTLATHVAAWGTTDTDVLFLQNDNGTLALESTLPALKHERFRIVADSTYHKHVRTLIYRGYHSAATRAAVSRYLGNKYGAAVA